jgi:FkbM family methyltransferase
MVESWCSMPIKALLEKCGIRCSRVSSMPIGVDEYLDLRRLTGSAPLRIIFDVGANVGNITKRFARCYPESQIYSFEPVAETYQELCRNTARISNVTRINAACGVTAETRQIAVQRDSEWNSLVPQLNRGETAGAAFVNVSVTTIDNFCRDKSILHVDLIKTDTEGFDLEVLQGAREMLSSGSVSVVLSEAGFSKSDLRHTYFFDLFTLLTGYGFKFIGLYNGVLGAVGLDFCNAMFRYGGAPRP